MNFRSLHSVFAMVAILMILVFACTSTTPTARACVSSLTYYVNWENPNPQTFNRSATPWNFAYAHFNFMQSVTPSDGIITTLTPVSGPPYGYADLGFGYTFGKLADVIAHPILITGSGTYAVNIYLDENPADDGGGNGPFFTWVSNTFTGLGGDLYGLGAGVMSAVSGNGVIDSTASFSNLPGGTWTIAQLVGGAVPGVDGNTIVGFWFGVVGQTTTQHFEIDTISGQPVVCPQTPSVGGEWSPITLQTLSSMNTLQLRASLIGIALAVAIAVSFLGIRRTRKRRH